VNEMKYYLAEYRYSASLAEFEGECSGKSYKCTDKSSFRELFGMIFLPRSGRVIVTDDRFVSEDKNDAVRWLVLKVENKINGLKQQIENDHKPELKSLIALYKP